MYRDMVMNQWSTVFQYYIDCVNMTWYMVQTWLVTLYKHDFIHCTNMTWFIVQKWLDTLYKHNLMHCANMSCYIVRTWLETLYKHGLMHGTNMTCCGCLYNSTQKKSDSRKIIFAKFWYILKSQKLQLRAWNQLPGGGKDDLPGVGSFLVTATL